MMLLTLTHRLSDRMRHVMCLSVVPSLSKASLEKTEAIAAQSPANTARENPTRTFMLWGFTLRMRARNREEGVWSRSHRVHVIR